jgi:hypothetical protein
MSVARIAIRRPCASRTLWKPLTTHLSPSTGRQSATVALENQQETGRSSPIDFNPPRVVNTLIALIIFVGNERLLSRGSPSEDVDL